MAPRRRFRRGGRHEPGDPRNDRSMPQQGEGCQAKTGRREMAGVWEGLAWWRCVGQSPGWGRTFPMTPGFSTRSASYCNTDILHHSITSPITSHAGHGDRPFCCVSGCTLRRDLGLTLALTPTWAMIRSAHRESFPTVAEGDAMGAHAITRIGHQESLAVPSNEHGLSDKCGFRWAVLFSESRLPCHPPSGDKRRVPHISDRGHHGEAPGTRGCDDRGTIGSIQVGLDASCL